MSCYEQNVSKITVITGKGSRSKNKENPYQSKNLSILKHSVPDYINSNKELLKGRTLLPSFEVPSGKIITLYPLESSSDIFLTCLFA